MEASFSRFTGSSPVFGLLILGLALFAWALFSTVQNFYRLRHIPGPFVSKFSSFWITWKFNRRSENFLDLCCRLDREYGPIVRWAPNNVLFSDPSVIPVIYGTHNIWKKAVSYEPAIPVVNGVLQDSLTTTRNEAQVSAIKRHINAAFTPRAIRVYEAHVSEAINLLSSRLRSQTPNVDLVRWIKLFAFETICRIAFSDVDLTEQEVETILTGARERFGHWFRWYASPGLERLVYKNAFVRGRRGTSLLGQQALKRINERNSKGDSEGKSDLLQWYLESHAKSPELIERGTVVGLVMSTINAGAETTASTMVEVLWLLLKNPPCLATLREELKAAGLASPPTLESVNRLPYLEVVIKETMRLNPVNQAPLEREVPPGGAHIAGVYLPGGTSVALNFSALRFREDVWGSKPEEFRPERWTEADPAQRARMERAFYGFGHGKRMCIGQHIAWIEMKKVIPELLLNYDVSLGVAYI
ncbi:uncharacterized protein A1O5_13246 [Cladophialophora psammophila CBS 110553]|uniref:Cytochrome P450 oxidoreductase n=1 Tax=Cladophialophora psammophila CBS 110553 TaxID=1182543 RepID=W9VKC2_9EURO|nr:uncharacterized protein A1O5_13246 [Cladophialophora psammophila CBS 110553]EXJ53470.1 hypothetical protein A1O5_13246 [Cladophialophora psammophila CBS 110553]